MWTASLWKQGYGQFYFAGRAQKAHRVAFELAYGTIPPGIEIDHICFRPRVRQPRITCAQ